MNYLYSVLNPRFPNCNIYDDFTLTATGISILVTAEAGYVVDFGKIDFESPRQLAVLKKVQAAREQLDAHFNLSTLLSFCIHYNESDRTFLWTEPDYGEVLTAYATSAGEAVIRRWSELDHQQDCFEPYDEIAELISDVKEFSEEIARCYRWRRILTDSSHFRDYPTAHEGYVYLSRMSSGHYKIGLSKNPKRRGRELTSGLPFTMTLIHVIPSNQISCLEQYLHNRFDGKRIRKGAKKGCKATEWFHLDEADVAEIVAIKEMKYEWIDNPEFAAWAKAFNEFHHRVPSRSPESKAH